MTSRFTGQHIHFIGIGGCGMSGLARMLLDAGAIVTGTDAKPSEQTAILSAHGATISHEQDGTLLSPGTDLVVRTAAIPSHNAEFQRASEMGLRQMKYAELIGAVMKERLGIAISGTHGKTTTTAMIAFALLECGADPSFVIGGTVPQLGGSSRSGKGLAFAVEACEFDRSFHNYFPSAAVITNIEADHLECYPGGIDEIVASFREFAAKVRADGRLIVNGMDPQVARAVKGLPARIESVVVRGKDDAEDSCIPWAATTWVTRITDTVGGMYKGDVYRDGQKVASLRLSVAGRHNLFNATAAVAACAMAGVAPAESAEALSRFAGADRRMTEVGFYRGAALVDDYGHHPTEIRTTLRALREKYRPDRLVCVFQPHQHSRTRMLLDDFATAFVDADLTILPDIYAARDSDADKRSVGAADLVQRVQTNGQNALHLATFPQVLEHLRLNIRPGDLVVTMGAGDVGELGAMLMRR